MNIIPFHPYADIFPLMQGAEFDAMVEDVRLRGIKNKIKLFENQILDGRNRFRAMVRLLETGAILGPGWGVWAGGVLPEHILEIDAIHHPFARFYPDEEGDPLDYVESLNIHRRDLTPTQRAMCAAEVEQLRHGGRRAPIPDPEQAANLQLDGIAPPEPQRPAETRADLAEKYHVSERMIADGAKVRDQGAPELKEAARQGEIVADVAAAVAEHLPKAEQTALIESLPRDEDGKLTPDAKKQVRALAKELRTETQAEKKARRDEREREQGQRQLALPDTKYGVIVADPEHDFEPRSRETGMDRHVANHYATSALELIMARRPDLDALADKDCVLGLWVTDLANGLKILEAWGFTFKSYFVWVKDVVDLVIDPATLKALGLPDRRYLQVVGAPGMGFWNRDRDELMLIGVRGNPPCPAMGTQGESVWFAARPHVEGTNKDWNSAKPDICFGWFNQHFPTIQKIELNARIERDGWDRWGLEAPESEAAAIAPDDVWNDVDPATGQVPPMPWSAGIDADAEAEEAARIAAEGTDA